MKLTFNEALALIKTIQPVLNHGHSDANTRETLAAARLLDAVNLMLDVKEYTEAANDLSDSYAGHFGIPTDVEICWEDECSSSCDCDNEEINIQEHIEPDAFGD